MQQREEDAVEAEPPPGWVLSTPVRPRDIWTLPVFAALLASVLVALAARFGTTLGLVVCVTCAVVAAAGAVAMAVAGPTAYEAQTRAASWRLHVVRLLAGVTTAAFVAVGSLVVGLPIGMLFGAIAAVPTTFRLARSVPRTDRLVVAWASVGVAVACTVLLVLGLSVPDLERPQAIAWVGPGGILGLLALGMAIVQFRIAGRTPRD